MDSAEIVAAVQAERIDLAGFLDGLDQREWATGSLCAGWTVPAADLLLLATGRVVEPDRLSGPGAGQATARVSA